jgi:hypothetical protein
MMTLRAEPMATSGATRVLPADRVLPRLTLAYKMKGIGKAFSRLAHPRSIYKWL